MTITETLRKLFLFQAQNIDGASVFIEMADAVLNQSRQLNELQEALQKAAEPIEAFELRTKGVMLRSIVRFEGETSWCKASEVAKRMEILRSAIKTS